MSSTSRFVRVGFLSLALLGIAGCRSDILKEPLGGPLAARVEIVEGFDCPGLASVATPPEHCAWPPAASRSLQESAVLQVIAHVGAEGHAESVQVVGGPSGFDAAAVDCAMRIAYRPLVDENRNPVAGDTCRVSFRLARYASDVNPADPYPSSCPVVRSPQSQIRLRPGTCAP